MKYIGLNLSRIKELWNWAQFCHWSVYGAKVKHQS